MNKIPRFMREYANHIEKKYFDGHSSDIENMLSCYFCGLCTVVEVMSRLAEIDMAWGRSERGELK